MVPEVKVTRPLLSIEVPMGALRQISVPVPSATPRLPEPASVVTEPVVGFTQRTRSPPAKKSETIKAPEGPANTATGPQNCATL